MAIQKCVSYDLDAVSSALDAAFVSLGGLDALLGHAGSCLVKPNLLSPSPASAAITTHPAVVEAVARASRSLGLDVVVGDSPGRGDTLRAAEASGVAEACRRAGVRVVPFDEEVSAKHPSGSVCKEFVLARQVTQAGVIVNVAKMKTHGFMTYTGAVKNLYGCIPGTKKAQLHLRFQEPRDFCLMLLDLYTLIRPTLSILDAVIAMDGDGPSHGRPRPFGAILVSTDAVALDTVAMHLAKADPMRVPYLASAREIAVGETRLENIEVVGDQISTLAVDDFRIPRSEPSAPFSWGARARKFVTARPVVDRSKCTGCGQCVRSCPPQVVSVTGGKASIDPTSCIRCYCCHEMCPQGAITLRRGGLARLADRVLDSLNRT